MLVDKCTSRPYTTLTWAYQLHYYLCFRTHRRRQLFSSCDSQMRSTHLITEISVESRLPSSRTSYLFKPASMPFESATFTGSRQDYPDTEKQFCSRTRSDVCCVNPDMGPRLFGTQQWTCPHIGSARTTWNNRLRTTDTRVGFCHLFSNIVRRSRAVLSAAHASFDLSHHLVFSTKQRKGVFTSVTGEALTALLVRSCC